MNKILKGGVLKLIFFIEIGLNMLKQVEFDIFLLKCVKI